MYGTMMITLGAEAIDYVYGTGAWGLYGECGVHYSPVRCVAYVVYWTATV